jgi:hypothetical protein
VAVLCRFQSPGLVFCRFQILVPVFCRFKTFSSILYSSDSCSSILWIPDSCSSPVNYRLLINIFFIFQTPLPVRRFYIDPVSPAYGYVSLALVKCSNEGGPGPRYNMKEVPGSSTLTMLVVHGYHLHLIPLFSEAGDWETSSVGLPSPPQTNLGKAPSRPLQAHTPPLAKMKIEASLGGNHTSASDSRSEAIDWARGGCGDHFGLFSAPVQGQGAELEASAG